MLNSKQLSRSTLTVTVAQISILCSYIIWKVDETYIKVKGKWKYLYRAVNSKGNTLDFMLSARRNKREHPT